MKKITAKRVWLQVLGMAALSLLLVQPLAAEETAQQNKIESFFQSLGNDIRGWLGEDEKSEAAQKETDKQTEPDSSKQATKDSKEGQGHKKIQKRMQKMSGNISESIDRDKKTVKKKLNKWFGDDKAKEKDKK